MNPNSPVFVLDSGVGGVSYLDEFVRRNPNESLLYLADTEFFPYGQRSPEEVRGRVCNMLASADRDYSPKLAVLACNTASVVALKAARETVDFPIVGVVPAVKPAAETTETGHIAILATNRTVNDPYTDDLVTSFAAGCRVVRVGLPEVVTAIESDYCTRQWIRTRASLDHHLAGTIPASVDRVVLACTHFIHVAEIIQQYLPPGASLVDSVDGVVRRMEWILDEQGLRRNEESRASRTILSTAELTGRLECLDARQWRPVAVT